MKSKTQKLVSRRSRYEWHKVMWTMESGDCWGMFERGVAYLVLPRVLLCGMPPKWQKKFKALIDEAEATYDLAAHPQVFNVNMRDDNGRFKKDWMTGYRRIGIKDLPYRPGKMPRLEIEVKTRKGSNTILAEREIK